MFVKYSENVNMYIILKISKFSTISSDCLSHVRPSSASAMAPDFSHKKGNHV